MIYVALGLADGISIVLECKCLKNAGYPTTSTPGRGPQVPKDVEEKPEEGVYVYGLSLEGCRWSPEEHAIAEARPRELFAPLPMLRMRPVPVRAKEAQAQTQTQEEEDEEEDAFFECALYRTSDRRGLLSTTGHSSNFLTTVKLPTQELGQGRFWTKRGAAAVLSI